MTRPIIDPVRLRLSYARKNQLRREIQRFASDIADTVREPLLLLDTDLSVKFANRAFYCVFHVNTEETLDRPVYSLGDGQWDIPALRRLLEEIIPENSTFDDYEVQHTFPAVGPRTILLNARKVYPPDDHPELLLLAMEDVTERRRSEKSIQEYAAMLEAQKSKLEKTNARLKALATTDSLTGLHNHRVFEERIAEEVRRAQRYGEALSLILLDVDQFKTYNDVFGHVAGNSALKKLARVLRNHVRDTDIVARFGGEEFVLILPHTDVEEAVALAERLRSALKSVRWDAQRAVTASFGFCSVTPEIDSVESLVSGADVAMYRAKASGGDQVWRA